MPAYSRKLIAMTDYNNPGYTEYKARINKVFDYIEAHIDHRFTLDELAGIASFSKFHFSRIFQSMTGEGLFEFILRIRLERSVTLLLMHPEKTVQDIALECGFSDISVFSRNFSQKFGIPPTKYRLEKLSNKNQTDSNLLQAPEKTSMYFCFETNTLKWRTNMKFNKSVEVKTLPEMTVAYVRHIGPYAGDSELFGKLFGRLSAWAGPRGLLGRPDAKSIIIYHDDPNVTEPEKLRTSVCVTVPAETKTDGEIGKLVIEEGLFGVGRFELGTADFGEAWGWLYGSWLPESGYQPDDRPCFEMYIGPPNNGIFTVDICVPLKPM